MSYNAHNDDGDDENINESNSGGSGSSSLHQIKVNFDDVTVDLKCQLPGEF